MLVYGVGLDGRFDESYLLLCMESDKRVELWYMWIGLEWGDEITGGKGNCHGWERGELWVEFVGVFVILLSKGIY